MKHILIICMHFYPVQFRVNDIALELVNRGYKVTVVTGIPNYPDAKFTKGYGWFKKRKENYQGINIIRIPIFPRGNSSISLILNYFSFNFFGFFFSVFSKIKADHVFIYGTSPLLKAMVGLRYAKRLKIKSTLYVMDLWPESVQYAGGIDNKHVLNYLRRQMKRIYDLSDHILVSSKSFVEPIHSFGIEQSKILYWPQAAESVFNQKEFTDKTEIVRDQKLNLIFTGTIAVAQGLNILVDVAERLKKNGQSGVRFVLVGGGRAKADLIQYSKEKNVNYYFQFIDRKPVSDIPAYYAQSDAALLTLLESPIFKLTIPAKLQSYMTYGIPVIASASGEVSSIITESECGLVSNSEDINGLYDNIIRFIALSSLERSKMAVNGKEYANRHFSKYQLMNQLEEVMQLKENKHV